MYLNTRIEKHTTITADNLSIGIWSHARSVCLGYVGEIVAQKLLETNNYDVLHTGNFRDYDLLVNDKIKIEVKTGKPNKRTGITQFCINRDNHCAINNADYVLLIVVKSHGNCDVYLIPTKILKVKTLKVYQNSKTSYLLPYKVTDLLNISIS